MTENRYPATSLSGMVERLAPGASSKYRSLLQRRDEVRALLQVVMEAARDVDTRGAVLASAINSKHPSDPGLARLQQQVTQLGAESEKLEKRRMRLQAGHADLDQTLSRLQNSLPGV